jgi:hypothetical protein
MMSGKMFRSLADGGSMFALLLSETLSETAWNIPFHSTSGRRARPVGGVKRQEGRGADQGLAGG